MNIFISLYKPTSRGEKESESIMAKVVFDVYPTRKNINSMRRVLVGRHGFEEKENRPLQINNQVIELQLDKEEEKPVEEKSQAIDLTIFTVGELKELAKKKEVKGYSKMKKEELIEILK